MSNITTIYDALFAELKVLFPDKKRLQNAIHLDENPDHLLISGYAVTVGDSENPQGEFCSVETVRTFGVVFTRQCVSTENNTNAFDNTQKELLECIAKLDARLCDGSNLDICEIQGIAINGSSGVESIQGDGKKFLGIIKNITITYREEIS